MLGKPNNHHGFRVSTPHNRLLDVQIIILLSMLLSNTLFGLICVLRE